MENFKVSRESQPTESPNDAEARADFWSSQGDFIFRYRNEPRVQLYVLKEETFPILLKYRDVTKSIALIWTSCKKNELTTTGMSIRASICQTRGDDSQSWKNNFPKDICGLVGYWQKFKRQLDQVTCGQKYGRKSVKPLRIEKTQNGKHEMGESIVRKSKVKPASQQLCFRVFMNVVSAKPSTSAPQQFAIEPFCALNCHRLALQRLYREWLIHKHGWARNCDDACTTANLVSNLFSWMITLHIKAHWWVACDSKHVHSDFASSSFDVNQQSALCSAANIQIRASNTLVKTGSRKLRSVRKIKSTSKSFVFGMLLYSDVEKVQPDWLCNHCWQSGVCQSKSEWPLIVLTSRLPEEYHCEEASTKVDTSRRVNCNYKNECHEKNWTLRESVQQKTVDQPLTDERLTELAAKDGHRVSWQTCTEATGSIDWNALILRMHDMQRFLSRLSIIRWNWLSNIHSIDTSTPTFSF